MALINLDNDQDTTDNYRTSAQAEIDLVLEGPRREVWAIVIKRSIAPHVRKGFHLASQDIYATKRFVIYPGSERIPLGREIEALSIVQFLHV